MQSDIEVLESLLTTECIDLGDEYGGGVERISASLVWRKMNAHPVLDQAATQTNSVMLEFSINTLQV